MGKQIMIDILVVLAVPVILIGGFYFWKTDDGALLSLLSPDVTLPGDEGKELGAKTKLALTTLGSIDFDESFFRNEAFMTLNDLTATVATTSLGREYPFTSPDVIVNLMKKAKPGVPITTPKVTPANASVGIDNIKTGLTPKPK